MLLRLKDAFCISICINLRFPFSGFFLPVIYKHLCSFRTFFCINLVDFSIKKGQIESLIIKALLLFLRSIIFHYCVFPIGPDLSRFRVSRS